MAQDAACPFPGNPQRHQRMADRHCPEDLDDSQLPASSRWDDRRRDG